MGKVSVVIPVRNGQSYVAEAVGSALAQGDCVAEVIVVDDHSSDRTVEIVSSLTEPRLRLLHTDGAGAGVSFARNLGLRHAHADWVTFLDADDRIRPDALRKLLNYPRGSDTVAIYGDYERIDAEGGIIGRRRWIRGTRRKPSGKILESLLAGNFIVNGGIMLVRRKPFAGIGGFDETLRYCEDWHAWCRLAARGAFAYRANTHVLDYRVHDNSTMMKRPHSLDDYRPALDAIFDDPAITENVPAARLLDLKDQARAHLDAYLLSQASRSRRFAEMFNGFSNVLRRDPLRLPRTLAVCGAAIAGL